jgi:hypothetical protein
VPVRNKSINKKRRKKKKEEEENKDNETTKPFQKQGVCFVR